MKGDPFYEMQENHNLIGVANIFLQALFYHVKLDYLVPIISQQGEVCQSSAYVIGLMLSDCFLLLVGCALNDRYLVIYMTGGWSVAY